MRQRGRRDLVLREELARLQLEDVEPARNLARVDLAVEPVGRPVATEEQLLRVERTAVEERNLLRRGRLGEVEHRDAALVPGLDHDVAARHRDERAVVRDAVLLVALHGGHLVVAGEPQLLVDDVEDGIGAPGDRVDRAAARAGAAAPLVGEDHLRAVVVEGGRVPVGKVLVEHLVETRRVLRV